MAYIISVDVGTTTMRSCLYSSVCQLIKTFEKTIQLIYVENEDKSISVEMEPERLWQDFLELIKDGVAYLNGQDLGIALCTQRNTFISWDKESLQPCHNLITWKDGRANRVCEEWNQSCTIRAIRAGGWIGSKVTGSARFKAAGGFKFLNAMVSHRFMVLLQSEEKMQKLLNEDRLVMGTLDTWLMNRLSKGKYHITEPSCASSTGLYDPFIRDWGRSILKIIGFPLSVLPSLVNTAKDPLCICNASLLGKEYPVWSTMGDAQAAILGAGVTNSRFVKVSLGTGTFVNVLTEKAHPTFNGVYPLVAWKIGDQFKFTTEARSNDTATCIRWAKISGFFEEISELDSLTIDEKDHGLHFIPAFSGIQTPVDDGKAICGLLGIKPTTNKRQILRSVVDSISFRVKHIWDTILKEVREIQPEAFRVCGGVAKNSIICQQIADLVKVRVERVSEPEFASAKGAALMAGITAGLWNLSECENYVNVEEIFYPSPNTQLFQQYEQWIHAMERCLNFYETDK
ncbi:unnamed protein product [Bursaphelenchus xylophilus]|uniref:(pine wood nematode) hypothetical protein n=1 Tax=Bursaphelenchus xylophilus TaxID=6326 RepID=A0A1I7SMB7_BURXY|nr:unnamed protein product [Bursaphelenchus xylophilus]CAG9130095.1 unnamed protein product [Bursaphelenchus xylophilus]